MKDLDNRLKIIIGTIILVIVMICTKQYATAVWIFIFGIVMLSLFVFVEVLNKKKYLNSKLYQIDTMTGVEFEKLLKYYFIEKGYCTQMTPKTNDYGADLILIKDNIKIVVQAKRYKNKVGIKSVQEIIGAIGYYKANKGIVVSNSFYTVNAINLAKSNNIELWDRDKLQKEFEIKDSLNMNNNSEFDIVSDLNTDNEGDMNFYEKVYEIVKQIPMGKVATYGQIALLAGSPRASRAVGFALHKNPDPSTIPCHRVVNRQGKLAEAFVFGGINEQRIRLLNEGVSFADETHVDMEKCLWDCNF